MTTMFVYNAPWQRCCASCLVHLLVPSSKQLHCLCSHQLVLSLMLKAPPL